MIGNFHFRTTQRQHAKATTLCSKESRHDTEMCFSTDLLRAQRIHFRMTTFCSKNVFSFFFFFFIAFTKLSIYCALSLWESFAHSYSLKHFVRISLEKESEWTLKELLHWRKCQKSNFFNVILPKMAKYSTFIFCNYCTILITDLIIVILCFEI